MREVATLIYQGLEQNLAEKQAQEIAAQNALAADKGMANAAKEPAPKQMPDEPGPATLAA
jgi:hypothetical protein